MEGVSKLSDIRDQLARIRVGPPAVELGPQYVTAATHDLQSILEKYGLAVTKIQAAGPNPGGRPAIGEILWPVPIGLLGTVGGWAVRRRPRRPVTS